MSNQDQGGSKRTHKSLATEAKSGGGKHEETSAEAQSSSTSQESEADKLLRKIFFRSGPLPMAPDGFEKAN